MPHPYEDFDHIASDGKHNALLIIENEQIVYASPAYLEMMGYKENELPGKGLSNIRDQIHPDDKEQLDTIIKDTLANKRPVAHYTFRERTSHGNYIMREDYAQFYYDKQGNHLRTYVICRDISDIPERKAHVDMLLRDIRVLIAEDNRMNMMLAKELILQVFPNCSITEAWNGQQAIDAFIQSKPDLVFMDIHMPEKDGYQASKEIRSYEDEDSRRVPVIAITARLHTGEKDRCMKAGMNDYIPKPIDEKEFKKTVLLHAMPYLMNKYINNNGKSV